MEQNDALTILLTGRSESEFADLIKKIVFSKRLNFDMICLKPEVGPDNQQFQSEWRCVRGRSRTSPRSHISFPILATMVYKQALLRDVILTYTQAEEVRLYEDRSKQYVGSISCLPTHYHIAFRRDSR